MISKNSQPNSINQTKEISSFLQQTKNQYIAFLLNDYEKENSKTRISHGGYLKKQNSKERENGKNLSGLLKVNSISRFINKENHMISRQKDSKSIFDNARLNNTLQKVQKQSLKRPSSAFTTIMKRPINIFQEKLQRKSQIESRQEMSLLGKSCVKVSFKEKQILQPNQPALKIDMKDSYIKKSKMYASKSSHCLNKFKLESQNISKQQYLDKSNETFIQNRQKLASQITYYNPKKEPNKLYKEPRKISSFKKVNKKKTKYMNSKKNDNSPLILKKQPNRSENIHNWNQLYQNKTGKKKIFSTQLRKSIKKSQRKIDQMKMMQNKPLENPLIMIENIDKERIHIDKSLYIHIASSQHFQRCRGVFQKISPLLKERLKMSPNQQQIFKKGRY